MDGIPTAISVSPVNRNNVYVSTSNGWVYYIDYTNALLHQRGAALPARYMTDIEASSVNGNTLYVAYSGYNVNTPGTPGKIFKSIDTGINFSDISGNLPDVPVSTIAVDPNNEQRIWAGTDVGVFQTTDGGVTWSSYRGNMPVVAIMDLKYNAVTGYLTVATHGRGIWRVNPDFVAPALVKLNLPMLARAYVYTPPLPVFLNADFEQGHSIWSETSTQFGANSIIFQPSGGGIPAPRSGTWLAWLGGGDNETSDLSQVVAIPAGTTSAYIKVWYQISSDETDCNQAAPPDAFYIYVNNDFGDGVVLCNAFVTGGWVEFTLFPNLAAYAGQTVTLHFRVVTDATANTVSSLFLDDVGFTTTPPTLEAAPAPGSPRTFPAGVPEASPAVQKPR
jgi:hypothetical protein